MIASLSIGSYELHADQRFDRWISPDVEGFDSPEYRETSYERAGEDGAYLPNQHYGPRLLRIPGTLTASSPANFAAARRELQAVCAITRDERGVPQTKTITVTTLDGLTFTIEGITRKPQFGSQGLDWCEFQLQIYCPRPQLLGASLTSGQVPIAASIGTAFPWTFDTEIEFSSSSGGVASVDNVGTMDGWLTLALRGALTNPTIYHDQSGQTMQLSYASGTNDEITIDMAEHAIVLNDSSTLMNTRAVGSDWFGLDVGVNTFRFSTGSTSDTGTLEVTGYAYYLGI